MRNLLSQRFKKGYQNLWKTHLNKSHRVKLFRAHIGDHCCLFVKLGIVTTKEKTVLAQSAKVHFIYC